MTRRRPPEALVIGGSAGALEVLIAMLAALPDGYPLPITVCLHRSGCPEAAGHGLAAVLRAHTVLPVREVVDKMPLKPGVVHLAPAGYHLLVETDRHFALSTDEPVHYSRPAIDVLFESAAAAFGPALVAVLLSGANADGRDGLLRVRERGGRTIVQHPQTAGSSAMPQAAIEAGAAEQILAPGRIGDYLRALGLPPQDAPAS